ncbi:MAG: CPBP family intramembrane glutamic endopeptidase [Bacteroidales bacterium]
METKKTNPLSESTNLDGYKIPVKTLFPFLLITFVLAWGILGLYIFLPGQMTEMFGQLTGQHPLFFLAVYAPAIGAFAVIISKTGWKGLRQFFKRLFFWRCSVSWYLFLLIGIPLIFYGGSLLKGNLLTDPFPFSSLTTLLVALGLAVIKGPMEEFGWRGLALPLIQRKFAPFWAAIILGIIWGTWHLPAFLLSGTQQSNWSFAPFFAGCIALSIIVTPLFNSSGGSILLSAFFHFMVMNPVFPDAEPYDTYILLVVAAIIVWYNRKTMFTGKEAVTRVIPLENTRAPRSGLQHDEKTEKQIHSMLI